MTLPAKITDLQGQRFGRLTVLERASNDRHGNTRWHCLCDCGTKIVAYRAHLRRGATTSCGCLRIARVRARTTRHGHTIGERKSLTYSSWESMKTRCENPNHISYPYYGGRGIKICDRWRESFEAFLADMGERPPGTSIDRIDPDGNYESGNCRWATPKTQIMNRRRA